MINRVVLVGRLTKDPELRYTQNGIATVRFLLAVNRPFSNQQGEKEADFINCIAWRKQAENLANYMKKGNLIGLEGRIQTGSYEGQDGKRVYTTDVIADSIQFLERNNSQQGQSQQNNSYQQQFPQQYNQQQQFNQQQYNQQQFSQQQYNQQQFNSQQNFNDLFASSKGPIEVNPDDLPF